jgi:DNA processing protein
MEDAESELAAASRAGAVPIFTIEPGYPAALAVTEAPPPLLYVRGDMALLNGPIVGIVGSRQASAAGQKLARQLARELGGAGFMIASGLARGIDAAAHHAALATGTVGVLAGGLDVVYPPEHRDLQLLIGERGCLVTEQPPGFQPRGQDFPRRNRIISGLSLGVVIVEAARRSGSLVTARFAAEQGREVFAVPGHPFDPRAEGTNRLLKDGATIVTEAADVIRALQPMVGGAAPDGAAARMSAGPLSFDLPAQQPPVAVADDDRSRVAAALGPAPVNVDEIVRATGLSIQAVHAIVLELALAGRIEHHGAQLVSLRPAGDDPGRDRTSDRP